MDEPAALPEGVPPEDSPPSANEQEAPEETTTQTVESNDTESTEPIAPEAEQAPAGDEHPAAVPDEGDPRETGDAGYSEPPGPVLVDEQGFEADPPAPVDPFADLSLEQARTAAGRAQLATLARAVPPEARALEEDSFQRLVPMVEACLASAVEDADASHVAALVEAVDTYTSISGERRLSSEPSVRDAPIWGNEQFWKSAVLIMADAARNAVSTATVDDTSPRPEATQVNRASADAAFQSLYVAVEHMLQFGRVSVDTMDKFIE